MALHALQKDTTFTDTLALANNGDLKALQKNTHVVLTIIHIYTILLSPKMPQKRTFFFHLALLVFVKHVDTKYSLWAASNGVGLKEGGCFFVFVDLH